MYSKNNYNLYIYKQLKLDWTLQKFSGKLWAHPNNVPRQLKPWNDKT